MARVVAVCISAAKGTGKEPVPAVTLQPGHGIPGDAHAGPWHRQLSALDLAAIEGMRARGLDLPYGAFGENVVIEGLPMADLGLGSELLLGLCLVRVTQIGKTCHSPCAIFQAVGHCIMPQEGLFLEVLSGGTVSPGDEVQVTRHIPRQTMQVAIVTVSDRAFRGEREDASGPALRTHVETELGGHVAAQVIVPDDLEAIERALRELTERRGVDVILTTGGTGCAPRDVTPEATRAVIEREVPGIAEQMRACSMRVTPHAMLSRATAGIVGQCLIINLPGSPRGAVENLAAIAPALPHAVELVRGGTRECARK